jgi:hypothetical protein
MPALGLQRNTVLALSTRDRRIIKRVLSSVGLDDPVEYEAPGGTRWYIFDSHRFRLVDLAYLGCLFANFGDLPGGYTVPLTLDGSFDWRQMRQDLKQWLENPARTNPLVRPRDIDYTSSINPWQTTLDAQNTPTVVRAGYRVPDTWVKV